MIEGLIVKLWKEVLGVELPRPFLRMPFDESMAKYGNDKPDLRFGLQHVVLTDLVRKHDGGGVPLMAEAVQAKGIVKAMRVPAAANFSRTEVDKLEEYVKGMGAKGLARAKVGEGGEWTQSPLAKTITPELRKAINEATGAKPGDLLLFQFGKESVVHTVMANLRVHVAKKLGLIPEYGSGGQWHFLWVVDPPLFEYDEDERPVGGGAPRLHPPARRGPPVPRERPGPRLLLPLRRRAQRLRDRRRLDPAPRPGGAGPGLQGARHRRGRGAGQVRLPARRPASSAPRRTAASRSAWTGS